MPLTDTGYTPLLVDERLTLIQQSELANIDPALDLQAESLLGQINGITAAALAELDAQIQAVYRAGNIDSASGESLDALVMLTGVYRLQAAGSTVNLTLTGVNGTVIPAGQTVSAPGTGQRFTTTSSAVIASGTATVTAQSVNTGPIAANTGTITRIDTPITGWTSVTNPLDATPGRSLETDEELRLRYAGLLFASGASTANAIRDAILRVPGVTAVFVAENDTDSTDAFGVPSHSFEPVVTGGALAPIFDAIDANKPAGIRSYGQTNSRGSTAFTRPTNTSVYVSTSLTKNASYPVDGDDQIEAAVAAYINALPAGSTIFRSQLIALVAGMPGVVDVTALTLGLAPSPAGTANLVPANYRINYQANVANIVVTST